MLDIYFLSKGQSWFVLQKCNNLPFLTIEAGDMFGIVDLIPADRTVSIDKEVKRHFCVMASEHSEILTLSMEVSTLTSHKRVGPVKNKGGLPLSS